MTELPTGTVTFLFTDLENSTRLWEEHPDAMPDALARHDGLLAQAVEAHGGRIVKGRGDGLHAAFSTSSDAVAAAVAAQRALEAEQWGSIAALRARIGLHTGVAERRGGANLDSSPASVSTIDVTTRQSDPTDIPVPA